MSIVKISADKLSIIARPLGSSSRLRSTGLPSSGAAAATQRAPSRILQACCAFIVLCGVVPWVHLAGSAVAQAIASQHAPLILSVMAWLVLLLPLWVGWFAIRAWEQRNVSARAAVLMAVPPLIVTTAMVAGYAPGIAG